MTSCYDIVTEKILAALESGTVPWHRPWDASAGMPVSIGSNKPYRGINVFLLEATAAVQGYRSPYWGTYKAISEQGGQVRRGEHSTIAVFWTRWTPKDGQEDDDESPGHARQVLRYYRVFNAEQADGLPARFSAAPASPSTFDPISEAESIMAGYLGSTGAPTVAYGGSRACYSPREDRIRLPERESFESGQAFYSTAFHEMTHSTGHDSRLARRDLLEFHHFGDESYSREELVAEMGAAMLSAVAGIHQTTVPQSAAYIAGWLKVLRNDSRLVVAAAAQAQRAADLIRGISWSEQVAA